MADINDHTVPVVSIDEIGLSYETNEFVIRYDAKTKTFYAGSDSGCSCYDGFNDANFEPFRSVPELRARFSTWIGGWYGGSGQEAAAWDQFNEAVRKV